MLGLKRRAAFYRSEINKSLHDGQFGSRPRRNAIDPFMLEDLQFEVSSCAFTKDVLTNKLQCHGMLWQNNPKSGNVNKQEVWGAQTGYLIICSDPPTGGIPH